MKLQEILHKARRAVAPLSPQHRRWKQFLKQLPLDVDRLPRPLQAPTAQDFIICGSPRTGTTLLAAILCQPPQVTTVMEPWDGMRLAPAELFASLRQEIDRSGKLTRGKLDFQALQEQGEVRWCQEGESVIEMTGTDDYLLGVKWPAYWRYLALLPKTKFLITVRHPFGTIASYKKAGGRVAEGLQYQIKFNAQLNHDLSAATSNVALRRILLYDYVNMRILPYINKDNVFVVRYERWFTESQKLIDELSDFLGTPLTTGYAKLRSPRSSVDLSMAETALIKSQCQSAELLGYDLAAENIYG